MSAVINDSFEVGQHYQSMINDERFTVAEIIPRSGKNNCAQVVFRCDKTGEEVPINIETAKRLAFKRITQIEEVEQ